MEEDLGFAELLFLGLAVWLLWLTWPLCWWAGLAGLVAWLLHRWHVNARAKFAEAVAKDLRDAAIAVTAGVGLVAAAQALLGVAGWLISSSTVRVYEDALISAKDYLGSFLSWKVQGGIWATLLVLSFCAGWAAVQGYNDRRKLLSRILIVLNTAASFTFFGATRVEQGERLWMAERVTRSDAERRLERLDRAQRELVAMAWVESVFPPNPPPGRRAQLDALIHESGGRPVTERVLEWRAERLLAPLEPAVQLKAAEQQAAAEQRSASPEFFETIRAELRAWAFNTGPAPRRESVRAFDTRAERVEHRLREAEVAVTETVKGALGGLVAPEALDVVAKTVVKTVTGTAVKTVFKSWFPKTVENWDGSREWVRRSVLPLKEFAQLDWWQVAGKEPPAEFRGEARAETTVGRELGWLQQQLVRQRLRQQLGREWDPELGSLDQYIEGVMRGSNDAKAPGELRLGEMNLGEIRTEGLFRPEAVTGYKPPPVRSVPRVVVR